MALRSGINAPAVLIEKYINSAYDNVKLVADNMSAIFDISTLVGAYLVADTAPTTRADGSALRAGDRWYNTLSDVTYAWDGDAWKAIGTNQTVVETQFAAENQATFTLTNPYAPGTNNLLVFINGSFQLSKSINSVNGSYTESNSTTIVFDTPLNLNDQVTFVVGTVITDSTTALSITKKLYTATGGETLVTIPDNVTYILGNNSLTVSIDGVEQYLATGAYVETSNTQVTFSEPLTLADKVLFTITYIA
jgi:hypothetical protein